MRTFPLLFLALIFGATTPLPTAANPWRMADVPLATPWADDLDPQNVFPEYPRPMMQREAWMNLNGIWQFQQAEAGEAPPAGRDLSESILVPFAWESALSGIRRQLPSQRAHYRRTFEVPAAWAGQRVLLHFGAVDWEATVYVNGRFAGQHRGGYDAFSFDITKLLNPAGPQELIVAVYDPGSDAGIAVGKQANNKFSAPGRFTYTPVSGIWQTVWLEPVPGRFIRDFHATPDIDRETLEVIVNPNPHASDLEAEVVARMGTKIVGRASGEVNVPLTVPVSNPRLWWPHDPFLYDLDIILRDKDGAVLDRVTGYFGMRKIALGAVRENNRGPVQKLFLNNRFVFQFGPLDQGYWPDGLYTPPTEEALVWEIEQMKDWGCNMVRKHIKVEPQRWYYHCDRLGLLVWQDMPSTFKLRTEEEKAQFEIELGQFVRQHWNHPSIVNWIVFNEHWGAYDVERLTHFVMALDPSRMVTGNSGIDAGRPDVDYQVGHIKDNHHYRPPTNPHPPHNRAVVNGEYGAIGYKIEGHIWDVDGPWVHHNYEGKEAATEEYEKFIAQLREYKEQDALSGAVYTQLTDVENEMNGYYTYDRKVEKLHKDRVAAANRSLWESDLRQTAPESTRQIE